MKLPDCCPSFPFSKTKQAILFIDWLISERNNTWAVLKATRHILRVTQYYTWTNMLNEIDFNNVSVYVPVIYFLIRSCHGHNRLVVGFTTTYVINAYYHKGCEFESRTWRGVFNTTLCDKVCQWLISGFLLVLRFPPPIKLTATI